MKHLGKLSIFDLYMLEKGDEISSVAHKVEKTCYILSGPGLFMLKKTDHFWSLKKVNVPGSPVLTEMACVTDLPKIKKDLFMQAVAFFKAIYDRDKTEAVLVLYWNPKTNDMVWSCPEQKNSGGSSEYKDSPPGEGYMPILHTHSHASMTAFHSGTDDNDEKFIDGYNITVGKLNGNIEYESRVMIGGVSIKVAMSFIIDGWTEEMPSFPGEWMKKAKKKKFYQYNAGGKGRFSAPGGFGLPAHQRNLSIGHVGSINKVGGGKVSASVGHNGMPLAGGFIQETFLDNADDTEDMYPDNIYQSIFLEKKFGGLIESESNKSPRNV